MIYTRTINERFRQVREEIDVSQEEFAVKANRTRSEIKNIEYGKTTPKPEVIAAICCAWNVNEDWLRMGTGEMFVPLNRDEQIAKFVSAATNTLAPSVQKRFISVLSMATTEELETIERFALRLAEESKKGQGGKVTGLHQFPNESKKTAAARSGDRMDTARASAEDEEAVLPPPYSGDI